MMLNNNISTIKQKFYVRSLSISCNGFSSEPALGHPTVYLRINHQKKRISCPYCSKEFIYKE